LALLLLLFLLFIAIIANSIEKTNQNWNPMIICHN